MVSDIHSVPTVHLEANYRSQLLAYAETANPTASILAGVNTGSTTPDPPAIAGFSSRGPSLVASGDLLKPDITAPGVDINAATSPEGGIGNGNDFGIISGTSMSSPHIAGLAALIIQKHPTWGPMEGTRSSSFSPPTRARSRARSPVSHPGVSSRASCSP